MKTLGLYIHVPFCKSKCRYCDFCSFPTPSSSAVEGYLDALVNEIGAWGNRIGEALGYLPAVDTVFFGGGTPTLLNPKQFGKLTEAIFRSFSVTEDAEITAECNPATADRAYFSALRGLGVNRLSVGIQSMHDSELKLLGRLHRASDAASTLRDARDAGFDNISADIMFGIPGGTRESLAATLDSVLALSPDHISVYGLQIEDGTYFARHQNELDLPDEETECAMYMDAVRLLTDRGLARYEISNFARPGRQSRHNLKYWRREDYLGLGLAAHSCLGAVRFSNTECLADYLEGRREATRETVSEHDILCERIMLGMRLDEGVDFERLGEKAAPYRDALLRYVDRGLVKKSGSRLSFTDDGMYVSNAILADVLDFEE